MLLVPCTQARVFRADANVIRDVGKRHHTTCPVVVRAMTSMWEAATDEQRKQFLHRAATDTLEENNDEMRAIEDRKSLKCRNPTRPAVHG